MSDSLRDLLFGTDPIAWIQGFFGLGHPSPFRIFSLLGDTWGVMLVMGIAFWFFGRRTLHAVIGIVVLGAATKVVLAGLFYQTRPYGPEIVVYEHLEVSSFPSGHVYAALGPWGLLYVLGCVPAWVPALVAGLVALGRLYLGVHYLGDVLGGILFGVPLVWAYVKLWPGAQKWLTAQSQRFYAGIALVTVALTAGWIALVGGHPRRYQIVGMIIGGALSLLLEHRFVRYTPAEHSWSIHILKGLAGTAGIAAFFLLDQRGGSDGLMLGAAAAGAATVWALLGAPALFLRARQGVAPQRHRRPV